MGRIGPDPYDPYPSAKVDKVGVITRLSTRTEKTISPAASRRRGSCAHSFVQIFPRSPRPHLHPLCRAGRHSALNSAACTPPLHRSIAFPYFQASSPSSSTNPLACGRQETRRPNSPTGPKPLSPQSNSLYAATTPVNHVRCSPNESIQLSFKLSTEDPRLWCCPAGLCVPGKLPVHGRSAQQLAQQRHH
jgi:hypothetical protein